MNDNTVVSILKTFSEEEMREFGRYVDSSFHNRRKETAKYFHALKKYFPEFSSKNFTKENLFAKVYPDKKFNDADIRRLNSSLFKLIESYLSLNGLQGDNYYFQMALAEQYNRRRLNRQFEKKMNEINKIYENFNGDAENYFWKKFFIEREMNSNYMLTQKDHLASEALTNRADYFALHTVINICKTLTSLSINKKNFNADFSESNFFEFVKRIDLENYISALEKSGNRFYPIAAIHFYQAMSLENIDNDFYFNKYKDLLTNNIENFSYIEKINFYTIFEAICTLKSEQGNSAINNELFDAYNRMLNSGLYSFNEGGYFILKLFRNFIFIGIQMNKLKWLKKFLKDYIITLHPESRVNMQRLAEAYILFEEKNFDESLEALSRIDFEIFHFKIDIRILQLKIFFELNLHEEAYSLIDTFRHFISNNKFISERYKINCQNFINFCYRLFRQKENRDYAELISLKKEISKNSFNKDWLLKKADEMI